MPLPLPPRSTHHAHMQQSAPAPRKLRICRLRPDLHALIADPLPSGTLLEWDVSTVAVPTCAVPLHAFRSKRIANSHAVWRLGPLSHSTARGPSRPAWGPGTP